MCSILCWNSSTHGKASKGGAVSGCYVVCRFCGALLTYVFAGRQKRAGNEVRRATVLFGASVGKMYFPATFLWSGW